MYDVLPIPHKIFACKNFKEITDPSVLFLKIIGKDPKGVSSRNDSYSLCIEVIDLIPIIVREVDSLEKMHAIVRLLIRIVGGEEDSVYSYGFVGAPKRRFIIVPARRH